MKVFLRHTPSPNQEKKEMICLSTYLSLVPRMWAPCLDTLPGMYLRSQPGILSQDSHCTSWGEAVRR